MNLVIDIGNTRAKLAVFANDRLVETQVAEGSLPAAIEALASRMPIEAGIVGSVIDLDAGEKAALAAFPFPLTLMSPATPVPIANAYGSPATLGCDRLAAAVAAAAMFPGRPLLVIDTGSCITFDVVEADGTYVGGNIAPGLSMRLRAMHEHTGRLPLVDAGGDVPVIGHDTETALRSGAVVGIRREIEGYAHTMSQSRPGLAVVLTGGDSALLSQGLGCAVRTEPHLVAHGLNRVLLHNLQSSRQ